MKAFRIAAVLMILGLMAGEAWGKDLVQGRFTLQDARDNKTVDQDSYDGKIRLVFFGFTSCRTVCPIGLSRIGQALGLLNEKEAASVAALFISVDPERDDAKALAAYAAHFGPAIIPLSGGKKAVASAMRSFRMEAQKTDVRSAKDYQMEHPAIIYLMDRKGRYLETMPAWQEPQALAERLRQALASTEKP